MMRHLLPLLPLFLSVAQAAPPPQQRPLAPAPVSTSEPRDVVLLMRLRSPEAVLQAVQSFVPVPGMRDALLKELGLAGKAVALAAPVDLLVALDPGAGDKLERPLFAFTVGLASIPQALQAIQDQLKGTATETTRGTYEVKLYRGDRNELTCLMMGDVQGGGRIACSDRPRDVEALGGYLLRTLPGLKLASSDLHAEVRVRPAMKRYGNTLTESLRLGAAVLPQKLSLGQPRFDRALADMTQGLVREISATLADLDQARLDLSLSGGGIELQMAYQLHGRTSWQAAVLREEAARAGGPPPMFDLLPADSQGASFSRSSLSPRLGEPIVSSLQELTAGLLEHLGLPEADRRAVLDLFGTGWRDLQWVWASGRVDAVPDKKPLPGPLGDTFYLGGFQGAAEPLVAWLRSLAAAYNRPQVQALLRRKLKDALKEAPLPTLRVAATPKGLPRGTLVLSGLLTLPASAGQLLKQETKASGAQGKGKAAGKRGAGTPFPYHVVVMPQGVPPIDSRMRIDGGGERTWLAMGAHLPTLVRRLKEQAQPAEERTLAKRPGLADLRTGGVISAGFVTLASFVEQIGRALAEAGKGPPDRMARLLAAAPHHGETPITFLTRTTDGPVLSRELVLRVPRPAIEDIVSMIAGAAMKK
jgi:hypothetical protein